ncbi:MAG TPA: aminodeoxychorismate synthase component I [Bacteroidales bacterium]|nr:aminodeoxychorismate synthase component I [Bacteroidales bacterium]
MILRSNSYLSKKDKHSVRSSYDFLAGLSALTICKPTSDKLNTLRKKYSDVSDWIFGYIGYDIKNEIEELTSGNIDGIGFSDLFFFQPKVVILYKEEKLNVKYFPNITSVDELNALVKELDKPCIDCDFKSPIRYFRGRFTKKEYINAVNEIKNHIQKGDIYEMNFCQEFYNDDAVIHPADTFVALNRYSPTPFATFLKKGNNYIISASPERFLKKKGDVIVSQPIKGTIARSIDPDEDESIKQHLKNDPKERAENIMIVDLVRNDLSKIAEIGSVNVDELCGVYPFRQLYQMISTISCKLKKEHDFVDVLKATFPMGSMTGAPKIRAMQLIEQFERTKRGLYSGSIGYITPDHNFDLNVVIRTLLYNKDKEYLSFSVGGAITINSDPEKEYQECMLKARAILSTLKAEIIDAE